MWLFFGKSKLEQVSGGSDEYIGREGLRGITMFGWGCDAASAYHPSAQLVACWLSNQARSVR